ncbi:MAG: nucleotidyltransferase [Myxococcota bacterium]
MKERRHPNYPGTLSTSPSVVEAARPSGEINARARALEVLLEAGVPFVVGGAYAFCQYTGIFRDTKDLDLFPRRGDALRALEVLAHDGWVTERTDEVWLYKAFKGEWFVDLIFSSGNGVADVDDEWFLHARRRKVMGQRVLIAPPEELIWSKAFVLERERYDGADVIHLIKSAGRAFDWPRLLRRFERHWEVLLSHLLLFRFSFPSERTVVPQWVMEELLERTRGTVREGNWERRVCRGSLISKVNFSLDIGEWGYEDGRRWEEEERSREAQRHGSTTGIEAANSGGR